MDTDGPAGDRANLPDLVHLSGAVLELEGAEDPDAAVGAALGGEVGRLVGECPLGAERVPVDGVSLHLVPAALGHGDERLSALHAVAGRVEPPRHPAAGGRGGEERHGEGRRRGVVGPVQRRAQAGQVGARGEDAVARELVGRAGGVRAARRGRRRQDEEDGEEPRGGHHGRPRRVVACAWLRGRGRGISRVWGRNRRKAADFWVRGVGWSSESDAGGGGLVGRRGGGEGRG